MKKLIALLTLAAAASFAQEAAPAQLRPISQDAQQRLIDNVRTRSAELVKLYDKNADGTLDEAETAALSRDMETAKRLQKFTLAYDLLTKVDGDRDFKLSDEEAARLGESVRVRRQPPPAKDIKHPRRRPMNLAPPVLDNQPALPPAPPAPQTPVLPE